MKLLLLLWFFQFTSCIPNPFGWLYIEKNVDVSGTVGCMKGGNFTPIEGIRVSIYEYDGDIDGIFDDFKNTTVTNKNGQFKLFAIDAEMSFVQFYVWISLSCELALREKRLTECFDHELCKPDATKKFLYMKEEIKLTFFKEKINSDGIFVCGFNINLGELKVKEMSSNYGPQKELLAASENDNFLIFLFYDCTIET